MFFPVHHKSLQVLHDGTMPPRAYYIPYTVRKQAIAGERESSPSLTLLSGEWKFRYFDTFEALTRNIVQTSTDIADFDNITVPRCWQTYTDRGYDKPLYSNLQYPFPTDPPHVPLENPCGVYLRDFAAPHRDGERVYIEFEGVSSCFYLFVNGEYCAYSQVSHCSTEIDITERLTAGVNRLCVVVVKWCDGSYLEDQDFFRLSGIFRDVYLLTRPKEHVDDIDVKLNLSGDLDKCHIEAFIGGASGEYELIDAKGRQISCGEYTASASVHGKPQPSLVFEVDNPRLWNAEDPYLYTLLIYSSGEYIPVQLGICRKEIKNGVFLLNGKRVVFRGVNRHDSNPDTGYAVSEEDMLRDLRLIKQANANAVRTSHYPNDPRFLEMCSRLGVYIIDEADIETHGMGFDNRRDWDWTRWSLLSSSEDWREAYVDRAALLYERDKNSPCVVMWSLGNESGAGVNHRAMAEFIRSRDSQAIIHYENSHKEFRAIPDGEDFSDISDVESRMYAGVGYIEQYLADSANTKPFFMCEYVCSMSTGDVYDYFRFADESDRFCGGCIWEFCDHAVNVPATNGSPRYCYGGDFGDEPNDGICCIDGLVYPDRRPRPGYYDMKKVYEPFTGEYDSGSVTVRNRRDFTTLDDLYVIWTAEADGKKIFGGRILVQDIMPGGEKTFELFDAESGEGLKGRENCFVTLSFRRRGNSEWFQADDEVGFLQFEIGKKQSAVQMKEGGCVRVTENERSIRGKANGVIVEFDKLSGCLRSYVKNGRQLIKEQCFDIWRAPNYNRGSVDEWQLEQLDRVKQRTYCMTSSVDDGVLSVEAELSLGAFSRTPIIRMKALWRLHPDGTLTVDCRGSVRENAPLLPHLGLKLTMPEGFEDVTYFGLGETESYPDRCKSVRYGEYKTTVDGMYEHYIRPQECGNRFGTRRAEISDGAVRLCVTGRQADDFSFKALHYEASELVRAAHDFELQRSQETYLNLDWRVNAISENPELDTPGRQRRLADKSFDFGFVLSAQETLR